MAKKFTMSLPESMNKASKRDGKRKLGSIQETIRFILSDYFKTENKH